MPIVKAKGDILKSGASFIVIPVNTVGVMGAGLAAQVKPILMKRSLLRLADTAPTGYGHYLTACSYFDDFRACKSVVAYLHSIDGFTTTFIFLPTKQDWRKPSRLEWVKSGLTALRKLLEEETPRWTAEARTVAIPALGCGLGGLCWGDVEEAIENTLGGLDKWTIIVYPPK